MHVVVKNIKQSKKKVPFPVKQHETPTPVKLVKIIKKNRTKQNNDRNSVSINQSIRQMKNSYSRIDFLELLNLVDSGRFSSRFSNL